MRKLTVIALAATTFALVSGCDAAPERTTDAAAIEKQIRAIETQWNADYKARNAAAIARHYSPDAALANPGEPLIEGADVRPMLDLFVTDPHLSLEFAADRVQVSKSGELAYSRGHFVMRSSDPATRQPRTDIGNYLTVWQKQADGGWKAVEDFIVPGRPATPAAAADPPAG